MRHYHTREDFTGDSSTRGRGAAQKGPPCSAPPPSCSSLEHFFARSSVTAAVPRPCPAPRGRRLCHFPGTPQAPFCAPSAPARGRGRYTHISSSLGTEAQGKHGLGDPCAVRTCVTSTSLHRGLSPMSWGHWRRGSQLSPPPGNPSGQPKDVTLLLSSGEPPPPTAPCCSHSHVHRGDVNKTCSGPETDSDVFHKGLMTSDISRAASRHHLTRALSQSSQLKCPLTSALNW